jgi:ribosomal protein L9
MFQTLKDYYEEISLLPKAVKIVVSTILVFAVGFAVYFGIRNAVANFKIERLEKQNFELNRQAQSAQEKAAKAEQNAANESLRAESLESQLKTLEAKTKYSDEKINLQSNKSSNLRLNLNRVRSSHPANISTEQLEKRLCARYGCR